MTWEEFAYYLITIVAYGSIYVYHKYFSKSNKKPKMKEQINNIVDFCHQQAKNAGWHNTPRET